MEETVKRYWKLQKQIPEVKMLLVTKGIEADFLLEFVKQTGHLDYAENYAQELKKWGPIIEKFPDIKITFIGAFQTGNIRNVVKYCGAIYGVSSVKNIDKIHKEAKKRNKTIHLYAQINLDDERARNGFKVSEIQDNFKGLFQGLMYIPPAFKNPISFFKEIKKIADSLGITNLSMGMSKDYLQAIECGATEVRVGSLVFKKNFVPKK